MSLVSVDITTAFRAQLLTCTASRGYASNVGASVHVGALRGAADQAPACFLMPGRQATERRYNRERRVTRDYLVKAFASVQAHPTLTEYALVDRIIWDVRRCIEDQEQPFDGLVEWIRLIGDQPDYHELGGSAVGADLQFQLAYAVSISDPETNL